MKLTWKTFKLPLKTPFKISYGIRTHQEIVVVKLFDEGNYGLGELSVIPYYNITSSNVLKLLNEYKNAIERIPWEHPKTFWQGLEKLNIDHPFLVSALDCAAYDLFLKKQKTSLRAFLNLQKDLPITNYTIGVSNLSEAKEIITKTPWPSYKIKADANFDMSYLLELSNITPSSFRIDANASWNLKQFLSYLPVLETLPIDFIEQPFPVDAWEETKEAKQLSSIPIIADESCQNIEDIGKCASSFDGINIKLMKSGGITPALEMIQEAKNNQLKIMLGCMTQSSIGIAAITQLLALADFADVDGALLLKQDIGQGSKIEEGIISLSNSFGLGVQLKEAYFFD